MDANTIMHGVTQMRKTIKVTPTMPIKMPILVVRLQYKFLTLKSGFSRIKVNKNK